MNEIIVALVVGTLTGIGGYVLGYKKSAAEISSLKADAVRSAGEHLLSLQSARRAYTDASAACGRCASALMELIKRQAGAAEIDTARESLCDTFYHVTIPAFLADAEWRQLDCNSASPDEADSLTRDIADELTRFCHWKSVFNHPTLLQIVGKQAGAVEARTMRPLERVIQKYPLAKRNEASRALMPLLEKLIAS